MADTPIEIIEVSVPSRVQIIEVSVQSRIQTVEVYLPGLPGPPGASSASYTHLQNAESAIWTVPHNLGHRPMVAVFTAGGVEISGETIHLSNDTLQIYFDEPLTGSVRCM
jgi:hypothetical protein